MIYYCNAFHHQQQKVQKKTMLTNLRTWQRSSAPRFPLHRPFWLCHRHFSSISTGSTDPVSDLEQVSIEDYIEEAVKKTGIHPSLHLSGHCRVLLQRSRTEKVDFGSVSIIKVSKPYWSVKVRNIVTKPDLRITRRALWIPGHAIWLVANVPSVFQAPEFKIGVSEFCVSVP